MPKLYPSDIWRLGDALDPNEKLVALALLDYGDRIYPSQAHVAVKTGLSLATVKRVVGTLRAKGVLSAKRNRTRRSRSRARPHHPRRIAEPQPPDTTAPPRAGRPAEPRTPRLTATPRRPAEPQ